MTPTETLTLNGGDITQERIPDGIYMIDAAAITKEVTGTYSKMMATDIPDCKVADAFARDIETYASNINGLDTRIIDCINDENIDYATETLREHNNSSGLLVISGINRVFSSDNHFNPYMRRVAGQIKDTVANPLSLVCGIVVGTAEDIPQEISNGFAQYKFNGSLSPTDVLKLLSHHMGRDWAFVEAGRLFKANDARVSIQDVRQLAISV